MVRMKSLQYLTIVVISFYIFVDMQNFFCDLIAVIIITVFREVSSTSKSTVIPVLTSRIGFYFRIFNGR